MESKWRIKFYVEKRKNNDKLDRQKHKQPIYMYVSLGNGDRVQIYTKESALPEHFSDDYLIRSKEDKYFFRPIRIEVPDSKNINNRLESLAKETVRIIEFADRNVPRIPVTKDYLKLQIQSWFIELTGFKKEKEFTFHDALEKYYQYSLLHHSPKTAAGFKQVRYNIEEFNKSKSQFKYLSVVDQKYVMDFENFLITKKGQHNKKLSHNTYCKNLKMFRTFLIWCKKNGFYNGNVSIKYKEKESDILFLTLEEINSLSNANHESMMVEKAKDVFIFGCFTGLRYGDIRKLKKSDYREGRIQYFEQKKRATIPKKLKLVNRALQIVEKYSLDPGEYLLPTFSNPNQYLKQAFKDAGLIREIKTVRKLAGGKFEEKTVPLWQKAGTHMQRKSFITLAIVEGMPEATIKAITGHTKDSNSFRRYYEMTNEMVDNALEDTLGKL